MLRTLQNIEKIMNNKYEKINDKRQIKSWTCANNKHTYELMAPCLGSP